jgi:N-acetylglucosamine-6-phosphate deacetylase
LISSPRSTGSSATSVLAGRLVLDDAVIAGRISVDGDRIVDVTPDEAASGPLISPGFVDLHVHGWGGHDAMGDTAALDGMARVLLRHGVTSFLPTAVTAPLPTLVAFADRVREWMGNAPPDGAEPLGFNLEGPFLARERRGAHHPEFLRLPADVARAELEPLLEGLRLTTVAPELPGALQLIEWLHERGVAVSMGHSAAGVDEARAGYAAGGTTTTHLFNAMSGIDHRRPGVAVAALTEDAAWVELIADGEHVHPALWPIITRTKPTDRLLLVSDAVPLAGTGDGRRTVAGVEIEVNGARCTVSGTETLAGSVIALDSAVGNLARSGVPLPAAVAAATRNPLALLGIGDRGRIAPGQRADLVELGEDFTVLRVMRSGRWVDTGEN